MKILSTMRKLYLSLFARKDSMEFFWKTRHKALEGRGISKMLAQLKYYKLQRYHGAYIPLSAQFLGKAIFPHGIAGVFISAGAKIGKDCIIYQQSTIGSNTLPGSKSIGSPTVGDNVFVGAGAKIIGNVKVGNHVRVGANCIVTKDIPDNCTVVMGAPRVIVHEEGLVNEFVSYDTYSTQDTPTVE